MAAPPTVWPQCLCAPWPDPRRGRGARGVRRLGRGNYTEFLVARGLWSTRLPKEKLPSKCFYSLLTIFSPAPPAAARPPRPSVVARPAVVDCCCTNAPGHAHRIARVFYKTLPNEAHCLLTAEYVVHAVKGDQRVNANHSGRKTLASKHRLAPAKSARRAAAKFQQRVANER